MHDGARAFPPYHYRHWTPTEKEILAGVKSERTWLNGEYNDLQQRAEHILSSYRLYRKKGREQYRRLSAKREQNLRLLEAGTNQQITRWERRLQVQREEERLKSTTCNQLRVRAGGVPERPLFSRTAAAMAKTAVGLIDLAIIFGAFQLLGQRWGETFGIVAGLVLLLLLVADHTARAVKRRSANIAEMIVLILFNGLVLFLIFGVGEMRVANALPQLGPLLDMDIDLLDWYRWLTTVSYALTFAVTYAAATDRPTAEWLRAEREIRRLARGMRRSERRIKQCEERYRRRRQRIQNQFSRRAAALERHLFRLSRRTLLQIGHLRREALAQAAIAEAQVVCLEESILQYRRLNQVNRKEPTPPEHWNAPLDASALLPDWSSALPALDTLQKELHSATPPSSERAARQDKEPVAAAKLLWMAIIALLLTGCGSPSNNQGTALLLIGDATEPERSVCQQLPDVDAILDMMNVSDEMESVTGHYGQVEIRILDGVSEGRSWIVQLSDPGSLWHLERGYRVGEVLDFRHRLEAAMDKACRLASGNSWSYLHEPLCLSMARLAPLPYERKVVILGTDFLEHTKEVSFYAYRRRPRELLEDYDQLAKRFTENCRLPRLDGVEFAMPYRPEGHEEIHLIYYAKKFYARLLEARGARPVSLPQGMLGKK